MQRWTPAGVVVGGSCGRQSWSWVCAMLRLTAEPLCVGGSSCHQECFLRASLMGEYTFCAHHPLARCTFIFICKLLMHLMEKANWIWHKYLNQSEGILHNKLFVYVMEGQLSKPAAFCDLTQVWVVATTDVMSSIFFRGIWMFDRAQAGLPSVYLSCCVTCILMSYT